MPLLFVTSDQVQTDALTARVNVDHRTVLD